MNYKQKSKLFIIILIISIQTLLFINNRQKTSFRYFIWNIEDVSIGRLIFISFISGVFVSSILSKTLYFDVITYPEDEEKNKINNEKDYSINTEDNNESDGMPPERDLRDPQPTISVNYRVIKNNGENELKDMSEKPNEDKYRDDWDNSASEW